MTTNIEWTSTVHPDGSITKGETWNPTVGCHKVSPGCKHCYAETMHKRLTAMGTPKYAEPFRSVRFWAEHLSIPLRWRAPRRVFVNSMSDLSEDLCRAGWLIGWGVTLWHKLHMPPDPPDLAPALEHIRALAESAGIWVVLGADDSDWCTEPTEAELLRLGAERFDWDSIWAWAVPLGAWTEWISAKEAP